MHNELPYPLPELAGVLGMAHSTTMTAADANPLALASRQSNENERVIFMTMAIADGRFDLMTRHRQGGIKGIQNKPLQAEIYSFPTVYLKIRSMAVNMSYSDIDSMTSN